MYTVVKYENFISASRGATTAEKLRGTKVWVARPAPGQRRGRAGGECGGGCPLSLWGSGGPGKCLKTQMLNPEFWWLLR